MKKICWSIGLLTALFLFWPKTSGAQQGQREPAQEPAQEPAYNVTRVIKTVEGMSFEVQEDRPIEKRGGLLMPLEMDSYIALKINKLQARFEKRFGDLEDKIGELSKEVKGLALKVKNLTASRAGKTQERALEDENNP